MTATCICPDVPPIESVPSEPIRCACCGEPLELTCAGRCGKEHVARAFRDVGKMMRETYSRPPLQRSYTKSGRPRKPHTWREKPCADCGQPFQPKGGRDVRCDGCKLRRVITSVATTS